MSDKKNFFSSLDGKTAFIFGLVAGLLVFCTIGFFILLSSKLTEGAVKTGSPTAANNNAASQQAGDSAQAGSSRVNVVVSSSDHIRGNKNAPVQIVEFSDYQCSYCSALHPTMEQIMADYGDQVAWVYKHFPIDSRHPQARPSAEAAECVAEQAGEDGFWEFTDEMFANQEKLSADYYEQVAEEIGVNMSTFRSCVSSGKYASVVEADYQQGLQYGVNGTPANFINGIPVLGAYPYSTFKQVIDSELAQ